MSGSLTSALDLTRTGHLGQEDSGGERADSFDAAEQLLRHFQSGRLPWSRPMGANKIGNNGSIQQIGFVAIASAASVLFDSPRIKQTHPMACAMEPQRKGMAVGSGGFQACPNLWNVVLFEDAGQLSKALGIILKAKAHCFAAGSSQLGLHAFLGDVQAQHRE